MILCASLESESAQKPLSVCELLGRLVELRGKIVTVRGEVKAGGHGPYLVAAPSCKVKLTRNGVPWPNVVNLAAPNNRSRDPYDHAPFELDSASVKRSEDEERRQAYDPAFAQRFETFTGLLIAFDNIEDRVSLPKSAIPLGRRPGFGPIGLDAPAQLLIKNVTNVVIVHEPRK